MMDFTWVDAATALDADGIGEVGRVKLETLTPHLLNGFHTLRFPDGSHKTFRVHRQRDKAKFKSGKRLIGLLIGPDNSADYESWGEVTEEGIKIWRKKDGEKLRRYADLIWKMAGGEVIDGYELLTSERCLVCNRTLSDPLSISRRIGPLCWERLQS